MNKKIVINCKNITKSYTEFKDEIQILKGINLEIREGEKIAILGLSGSGKTTLLNMLGGLDNSSSGEIELMEKKFNNISSNKRAKMRNQHLGFIYQLHHLLPEFTALENVLMPLALIKKYKKIEAVEMVKDILKKVGLEHRINHKPAELSGGERQRVAIARALVTKPNCILADEPTGNLDFERTEKIFNFIEQLSQENNISFVIVTHDETLANKMDKIYRLVNGKLLKEK